MAVTVSVPGVPAVTGETRPDSTRVVAAAGLTVMPDCVTVRVFEAASVAVIDWEPAVSRVAEKACAPASPAVKA